MKLVLFGGGGHCASCVDAIRSAGMEVVGVVDPREGAAPEGTAWLGAEDEWLRGAGAAGSQCLVTVGQASVSGTRRMIFDKLVARGLSLAPVRASSATVSATASIGPGSIVLHRAVVNAGARVGANCIVNTAALVEHGAVIEDHCHVATGAIVNGDAHIGAGCMIGSGAIVLQGVRIAPGTMVGAGAVVTRDIADAGTWAGVPARRLA